MRKRIGTILICLGILSMAAAGWLGFRNVQEQNHAAQVSQETVLQLAIPKQKPLSIEDLVEVPDYEYNPHMEMPEQEINGHRYIGTLEILDLDLTLPVMSTLTIPKLRIAPCRYSGTVYQDDLIIGAHNYAAHFGKLKTLSYGSRIRMTDMDGNQFCYEVADIEILKPNQVDDLRGGDWPLTLFTCTIGGKTRVVVRCERTDSF